MKEIDAPICYQHPSITMLSTEGKGRSLFATADIPKGELLASCPVLPISIKEHEILKKTTIDQYLFEWEPQETPRALVIGIISFLNHSENDNADYSQDYFNQRILLHSIKEIKAEEELLINYGHTWFKIK